MIDAEAEQWETNIRNMGAEPFLTQGVDVESHFLCAAHLSKLNHLTEAEMQDLLDTATRETRDISIEKYVNGRTDQEKKAGTFGRLNVGNLAAGSHATVDGDSQRYRHAKTVLKRLRNDYRETYQSNLRVMELSEHLAVDALETIAQKLKG